MFSLRSFSLLRGGGSTSSDPCIHQSIQTNSHPERLDVASIAIQDVTTALRAINNHPFKKYTIAQIQNGRFPVTRLGVLSRETVQQSVAYVMGYFGRSRVGCDGAHMALRASDNSEYLCRELFIASYNGLTTLSDIFTYDAICQWRVIRQVAQNILPQVLPSDFILQENELICHVIAEFVGAHVFIRCATLTVPLSWPRHQSNQAPTSSNAPTLFRGPVPGRPEDLVTDWNETIEYASSGLDSEEDFLSDRLNNHVRPMHTVSPTPPLSNTDFNYVSPRPLRLVPLSTRSRPEERRSSLARSDFSDDALDGPRLSTSPVPVSRAASRSMLSASISPQPSLQRSSSSAGHNFTSTSMHGFDEKDAGGVAGGPSPISSRQKSSRRHHTFVLADSHGRVLRDDIFATNWEEFDVMFWRGVRMCDVSMLVDQNLNLFTRMPHRRMWFMPTSPFAPRSHLSTPYAPLYQYYVKKWHFDPIIAPSTPSAVVDLTASPPRSPPPGSRSSRRVSSFYSLCADSQGLGSALSYTLPVATQTTHSYLFGNAGIQENDCKLFCAIDEPSAVFDVQASGSGDSSFSCSGSDDFHTALVIEELRAVHPSQANNDDEMSDADREYLYFEDQIDCDNVCVARCCEWNFRCGGKSGKSCDNVFIACCYDSSRPCLIFSSSFASVRRAKNHMGDCRRLLIPSLSDEREAFLMNGDIAPVSYDRPMKACKVKFDTLSSTQNDRGTCANNNGILIAGVQYVNPQPNVEPNSCTSPVFVPGSTKVVIYKFDSNLNVIGSHAIGRRDVASGRRDLSDDIGVVFVLEDMVVTHEFIYVLLSAEPNPHFLGRRLSSNPWMRLPHHDDSMSSPSEGRRSEIDDLDHVSDEDEEDDCPRFRNVDNRWRVILRTEDLSFVCIEPDRVQFPGATLGCVVPMEMFDI